MTKKKSTSKPPRKPPRRIPKTVKLADGTEFVERYSNDKPTKHVYDKEVPDREDEMPPKDKYSKLKYPPPRNGAVFREKWGKFIESITSRENFKVAHLQTLEILCDMYEEYEDLQRVVRTQGRTYKAITRFGETIRMRPEIAQLEKVQSNIRNYTKLLGLFPKSDKSTESEGEQDEWN